MYNKNIYRINKENVENIRKIFLDFQKYLYEEHADRNIA